MRAAAAGVGIQVAGWLYRAGLEHVLGLKGRGDHFTMSPCVPSAWTDFSITWKHAGRRI
jgi:cellobiose phosphorylase